MDMKHEYFAIWEYYCKKYKRRHGPREKGFAKAIRESIDEIPFELFDEITYLRDYPDAIISKSISMMKPPKINPLHILDHYLQIGRREGRNAYCIRINGEKVIFHGFNHKEYIKVCLDAHHAGVSNELNGYIHFLQENPKPKIIAVKTEGTVFSELHKNQLWISTLKEEWARFNPWKYKVRHSKSETSAKELFIDYLLSSQTPTIQVQPQQPQQPQQQENTPNKVLIVMPTYNRASNIEAVIQQIESQTYTNWTFLIIDDGSTPENKTIFHAIREKYQNHSKIVFKENECNKHIAYTLNRGIEYLHQHDELTHLTWISDDNVYFPHYLERLINANAAFAYGYYTIHKSTTGRETVNSYQYTGYENVLNDFHGCAAFMWSKDTMKKVGMYREDISGCEDFEYLVRTFKVTPMSNIFHVKISLMCYHIHSDSSFSKGMRRIMNLRNDLIQQFKGNRVASSKTVSIVVLCYNKIEYTRQCIESVIRYTNLANAEIIVVNNASTDGTREYLEELRSKHANDIHIIHNSQNLGFSKGMNIGLKHSNSEYVILLNNDTLVGAGWDYELISILRDSPSIFAVTPVTNNSGNESKMDISHNHHDEFFAKYRSVQSILPSSFSCNSLGLFCGAFRRNELCDAGGLDEAYLNGWEDDDLYEKILQCGKKVHIATRSVVYHFGSVTVGKHYYSDPSNSNKIHFEKKWNKSWMSHGKHSFITDCSTGMEIYRGINNVNEYIMENYHEKGRLKKVPICENAIQIDPHLYEYLHGGPMQNVYHDIHDRGINEGLIYSINQFKNYFELGEDVFYKREESYFCRIQNHYIDLRLLADSLYEKSADEYIQDIRVMENTLTENLAAGDAICSYIGDEGVGHDLLQKLLMSNKTHLVQLFICKTEDLYRNMQETMAQFPHRIVFRCKEYGSDIIPSLQAIHYAQKYNLQYIYKFHTKSDKKWFDDCTDYLLQTDQATLKSIAQKKKCVGPNDYYLDINHRSEQIHCIQLKQKYLHLCDKTKFVKGSMFFCKMEVFTAVLQFIKQHQSRSWFLNNGYDTNIVNLDNSPTHFLERLFGIIRIE
jgi:GT2 family glycosyltransferase